MNYRKVSKGLFFILILATLMQCSSPNKISVYDISTLYETENKFTTPENRVFHLSDTLSTAILGVYLVDLHYEKPAPEANYSAMYEISYRLQDSYESRTVADSSSFIYIDSVNFGKDIRMIHSFDFQAIVGDTYILELRLKDLNMPGEIKDYIRVNKSVLTNQQGFLPVGQNRQPLFRDYLNKDEEIKLRSNNREDGNIFVSCYFRDFPIASPPFVSEKDISFDYRYDSLFALPALEGETGFFDLGREGFYHFQTDTSSKEGFTLYRFYEGFPEVITASDMIAPLRYITTKKEFEDIVSKEDKKDALDDFWLNSAGNELRARNLIQRYYSNVVDANRFFTSYHEGWKTDRGLIYIIFGKPTKVYRGKGVEEWVYGEPENRNSLRFTFVRVINPFSYNDYMLLRSPTYKEAWYVNVQSWRR